MEGFDETLFVVKGIDKTFFGVEGFDNTLFGVEEIDKTLLGVKGFDKTLLFLIWDKHYKTDQGVECILAEEILIKIKF